MGTKKLERQEKAPKETTHASQSKSKGERMGNQTPKAKNPQQVNK